MANVHTSKTANSVGSRASNQGKGTWTRKRQITDAEYAKNWARIFGKPKKKKEIA